MDKKVEAYLESICSNLDLAIVYLTPRGNGERLRATRPEDGTYAYLWRMCRFHSGVDLRMPIACHFHLSIQIEKETGKKYLFGIMNNEQMDILNALDNFVTNILCALELDGYKAVWKYKGLLY